MEDGVGDAVGGTVEERRTEVHGRPARIHLRGPVDGDPVVLVDAAVPMAWSAGLAELLAAAGHRVVGFDYLPPDGWVGAPIGRTCREQADDVLEVMTYVGIDRAHVVGTSRGGVCAYWVAVLAPERVRRLVLWAPVAPFADLLHDVGEAQRNVAEDAEPADALATMLDSLFGPAFAASAGADAVGLLATSPASVVRVPREAEEAVHDDARPPGPVLVVIAEDDAIVERQHPDRIVAALPDAQVAVLPGARHGALLEDPATTAALVAPFLAG